MPALPLLFSSLSSRQLCADTMQHNTTARFLACRGCCFTRQEVGFLPALALQAALQTGSAGTQHARAPSAAPPAPTQLVLEAAACPQVDIRQGTCYT